MLRRFWNWFKRLIFGRPIEPITPWNKSSFHKFITY